MSDDGAGARAEYLVERRKMMQAWADYLDALRAGAEVVPLFGAPMIRASGSVGAATRSSRGRWQGRQPLAAQPAAPFRR